MSDEGGGGGPDTDDFRLRCWGGSGGSFWPGSFVTDVSFGGGGGFCAPLFPIVEIGGAGGF